MNSLFYPCTVPILSLFLTLPQKREFLNVGRKRLPLATIVLDDFGKNFYVKR